MSYHGFIKILPYFGLKIEAIKTNEWGKFIISQVTSVGSEKLCKCILVSYYYSERINKSAGFIQTPDSNNLV